MLSKVVSLSDTQRLDNLSAEVYTSNAYTLLTDLYKQEVARSARFNKQELSDMTKLYYKKITGSKYAFIQAVKENTSVLSAIIGGSPRISSIQMDSYLTTRKSKSTDQLRTLFASMIIYKHIVDNKEELKSFFLKEIDYLKQEFSRIEAL